MKQVKEGIRHVERDDDNCIRNQKAFDEFVLTNSSACAEESRVGPVHRKQNLKMSPCRLYSPQNVNRLRFPNCRHAELQRKRVHSIRYIVRYRSCWWEGGSFDGPAKGARQLCGRHTQKAITDNLRYTIQ